MSTRGGSCVPLRALFVLVLLGVALVGVFGVAPAATAQRDAVAPAGGYPTLSAASLRRTSRALAEESRWIRPADGPVTSQFGPRWGRMHRGKDIGGVTGDPVVAAADGTVTRAGTMSGYGRLVEVDHADGATTVYAHLSAVEVGVGDVVSAGDRVGGMGCTGSCTGTHLHFEVRVDGDAVDPRDRLP